MLTRNSELSDLFHGSKVLKLTYLKFWESLLSNSYENIVRILEQV